jgi:phosphatidylserine/phosphatidylglycerophosphate/cardiolipin synthase-like enzyme
MRGVAAATLSAVAIAGPVPAIAGGHEESAAMTARAAHVGRQDLRAGQVGAGQVAQAARRRGAPSSAVFNIPSGSAQQQNAIGHHVNELAAGAPRGALIRVAVYQFTSATFAQTLVDAGKRGVHVQLVIDASSRSSAAYRRVAKALGTSRKRSSWVTACTKGCIGDTIMHNKFYLFSRSGSARDVVVQASANLTTSNRVNAWNNAFTISDRGLYRGYGRYFSALAARRHHASYYHVTRSGRVTAYTFPRAGSTTRSDTLYELLGHVGCARGTAVHVTTFSLTRTRVAQRLWSLAHQGCDVRIIYTNLGTRARRLLTRAGGPQLLNSHYRYLDPETGEPVQAYVHSKYVAIAGTYSGHQRRLVITGSPNYTVPGLRHNDETMLAIDDPGMYAAYQANFDDLWQAAGTHVQLHGHVPDPR